MIYLLTMTRASNEVQGISTRTMAEVRVMVPFICRLIDILDYAPMQSLIFSDNATLKATYHNFRDDPTSSYHTVTAIIVSMGALHTPQLLMTSGIGPEEQLSFLDITPILIHEKIGQRLNDHLRLLHHGDCLT